MTPTASILIIDDDKGVTYTLNSLFQKLGHSTEFCHTLSDGLETIRKTHFDILFLDVMLPDGNGLEFLKVIDQLPEAPMVIVMTTFADPDGAEQAILNGAWDYLEKPLSLHKISLQLMRALQYKEKNSSSNRPVFMKRQNIIGDSKEIQSCFTIAAKAANCQASVLILGETGTGKELFAKAIHENSNRSDENFVVLDCGIMTETLVESMLFGHTKGAFTGADKERTGIISLAHKGTLFLDEIGDLPMSAQSSFLRVLQEHRFRPIGGKKEIESDFRVVAATNKDLDAMVKQNKFRHDLLFRLKSIILELPPLKNRTDDIKALVLHYIAVLCDRHGLLTKGFSPDFLEALQTYPWPGNTRELINVLDSAIAMAQNEPTLFPVHLPKKIRIALAQSAIKKPAPVPVPSGDIALKTQTVSSDFTSLKALIHQTEKKYFESLFSVTKGDIKTICRISELSRAMVYARLKKYNLSRN